jgi:hypothetical protein
MDALPGILIASSANPGPFPASYRYFMEPDGAHFAPETGKCARADAPKKSDSIKA